MGSEKRASPPQRAKILSAVADLINADPESEWLVVHHVAKPGCYDIKNELNALLACKENVRYIHWGLHAASNDHRDVRKVIVLGSWRKPEWTYGAMAMASSARNYVDIAPEERIALRLAEHQHDFMQAVGRSNIRNVEDGVAGAVDVYAVMSPEHAEACINGAFPGCGIEAWQPVERIAKGQLAALIAHLSSSFSDTIDRIRKREVYTALGISSHGLANLVRDDRTKRFLARMGITVRRFAFERELVPA